MKYAKGRINYDKASPDLEPNGPKTKEYVRTAGGIFKVVNVYYYKDAPDTVFMYKVNKTECALYALIRPDEVIKESDTIEELCDEFVIHYANGYHLIIINGDEITFKDDFDYGFKLKFALENGYEIYGDIWTTGEHKEPILKTVAKMTKEWELELL